LEDLGGVAELLGELLQDRALLLGIVGGPGGLQELAVYARTGSGSLSVLV
jgi:hypothetical protein